ncbi:MAG: hypothetical protein ACE5E7_09285 [Anaerolineae bacterium]
MKNRAWKTAVRGFITGGIIVGLLFGGVAGAYALSELWFWPPNDYTIMVMFVTMFAFSAGGAVGFVLGGLPGAIIGFLQGVSQPEQAEEPVPVQPAKEQRGSSAWKGAVWGGLAAVLLAGFIAAILAFISLLAGGIDFSMFLFCWGGLTPPLLMVGAILGGLLGRRRSRRAPSSPYMTLLFLLLAGLFLDGCTPAAEPPPPTPTTAAVLPSATAVPPTQTPEATETPVIVTMPLPPTSTPPSTPSPTPTVEPTITPTPPPPTLVEFNGIHFLLDGRLADQTYPTIETWGDTGMTYTLFKFTPEGLCRDVGCIEVYDVAAYEAARPDWPLPPVGAAVILKTRRQTLAFQNGSGSRDLRMYGQMGYFANNEALLYEYRGFTADGRFYILVSFPLDASILFSGYEPDQNTNLNAIPLHAPLPDDFAARNQMMMAYNQEAAGQLALLAASDFSPDLTLLDELAASVLIETAVPGQ